MSALLTLLLCLVVFSVFAGVPWLLGWPERRRARKADQAHYDAWIEKLDRLKRKLEAGESSS